MSRTILETELLTKTFFNDEEVNHILKNINLKIEKGDFTIIMGSSGSGKSTLIYALSGLSGATKGKVYLDREDITNFTEKRAANLRRNKIGFVFQNMNLIPDITVAENILSPTFKNGKTKEENMEQYQYLITQMELEKHQNKFPNQLSGGERQRAAICRALINRPEVLFADEPTGALNSATGEHVLDVLTEVHKSGQSIVMVTHDLNAAIRGNRILYLKDGRIDGDFRLDSFHESTIIDRKQKVYEFLKERGW